MSISILATKLYVPPSRPKAVQRAHLIKRLNEGLRCKLTLIAAPAGFGKTTLISEWIASLESPWAQRVAWLSLEEGDNDSVRFLTYLVAALQTIAVDLGQEILNVLQSSQPPRERAGWESFLTSLLNEISRRPDNFVLVLDDYHVIETKSIDEALTFVLEHLPPQMHLLIATREDPHLPLARLRAGGQLMELRAADLRFTAAEAADFLKQVMGLTLSVADVAALEERTEGWIAGLQLAALSLQGHQDVTGFIRAFTGDHRYIVDYLVEEVLQRQPAAVRSFLLQTAILDRLNGPLCDAVTGQQESHTRLEALQRGNFFIVPLDDKRHWYRYHHLFAEVLHAHLLAEQPDQLAALHQRASEWYEHHDMVSNAVRHALAGKDFGRAAVLIERALPVMRQSRQEVTMLSWFQALPHEVFQHRPILSAHYAGTLLQNGQLEGVESRLQDAERWLAMPAELRERPIFVDEEELQRLPATVAMYHAGLALARGDVANTMKYAQQVLALANEDFMRGAALSLLGLAYWTDGDLETAYRMYGEGMAHLQKGGYISDVIGGSITLADLRIIQGRPREAMKTYEHGLQLATKPGVSPLRGAADMHVGVSELYLELNDLDTAMQHLLKSKELGELNGLPKNPYRWRIAMARLLAAQGELDSAVELLDEAEPLYVGDFAPNFRPVRALKTRVWIAQGRLSEALGWAREQGLSVEDDLRYLREFEHITLARIRLAQHRHDHSTSQLSETIRFLERLLKAAEVGGRMGSVIEILLLQALANQLRGDTPAALPPLERALTLAGGPIGAEGYVRIFLDEAANMRQLLREADKRGIMRAYTDKLLAAFEAEHPQDADDAPRPTIPASSQPLIEPLSQRELELLRLFKTELSGPEIAQELVVALSTIRTHTKSIYSKLNVNSRRAAVNRAIELGLI